MQNRSDIVTNISLLVFVVALAVLVLGLFPFTDNFIVQSKTYFLFIFAGLVGLLFALKSMSKQAISLLWSPLSLPVLLFGGSMLASSLLTNSYPQESLLGMGGVFIAGSVITLLGGVLLPKNAGSVISKSLAVIGVLLTVSSALQLLGYGPSKLIEPLLGLALPHTIAFNLTGSSLIALQVLLVAVVGLIATILQTRFISKFSAVVLPILLIGIALHGWSLLPGKPATLILPSLKASWSVALDTIREPRSALIGVGPAAYANAYLKFKPLWVNATPTWNIQFSQAADAPLYLLTIGGFVGLASWLFLLVRMVSASKQGHHDTRPFIITALACGLLQLFLPSNVIITGLQFILLAAYLASEVDRLTLFKLKAPSLSLMSENAQMTQASKAVAPIYLVALAFAIGFGTLLFFVGKGYAAELALHRGTLAAQKNDGIAVYTNHQQAVTINPEPLARGAGARRPHSLRADPFFSLGRRLRRSAPGSTARGRPAVGGALLGTAAAAVARRLAAARRGRKKRRLAPAGHAPAEGRLRRAGARLEPARPCRPRSLAGGCVRRLRLPARAEKSGRRPHRAGRRRTRRERCTRLRRPRAVGAAGDPACARDERRRRSRAIAARLRRAPPAGSRGRGRWRRPPGGAAPWR